MTRIAFARCLFTFLFLITAGCASYMHGYTQSRAMGQYLKVDEQRQNFGFQRVHYIIGFRGEAIGSFIDEKGFPDYLYEYEKEDSEGAEREGFVFYYLDDGKAYDFMEKTWAPTSAQLVDIRKLTAFEKNRFGIED